MLRILLPGAALALMGAVAAPVVHYTAPPPGHTGGFGEPDCTACHMGDPVNAYGGSVRIVGLPRAWVPGERYALTVILEAEETSVAGFELAARWAGGAAEGEPAGTLAPLDAFTTVTVAENGHPYLHHTAEGSRTANPDGATWMVAWTAPTELATPAAEPGGALLPPVVFHVAANSGNGDNSPLLDLVYVGEATVPAAR